MSGSQGARNRPQSPNIQIYRPQLTSVLSIANRISGVVLAIAAVVVVAWLLAAAEGPQAYGAARGGLASPAGRIALFATTFAFFLHLCGGIRHLAWDAGYGFELRASSDLCFRMGRGGGERGARSGGMDRGSARDMVTAMVPREMRSQFARAAGQARRKKASSPGGESA